MADNNKKEVARLKEKKARGEELTAQEEETLRDAEEAGQQPAA